jgi:hypothetical protein
MKPRFAAVWMLAPLWTTPIAPPLTAAFCQPRRSGTNSRRIERRARGVESEPCKITPTFTDVEGGVQLDIDFVSAAKQKR